MLMNSYIAAAVLAFCAAQTGAAPVAVPPPELLAEKNIAFQGFDPSTWTPAKRDAEAQWNTANKDGSVPDSFMQAVNKWQKAKNSGSSSKSNNDKRDAGLFVANPDGTLPQKSQEALERWNKQFLGQKRDALSVAVGPDGYVPPEVQEQLDRWDGRPSEEKRNALSVAVDPETGAISPEAQEQLDRWNRQFGYPAKEKRDALSVAVDPETGSISPESQAALDRWNKQFGYPAKRAAEEQSKQNLPQGPGVLDLKNGEYRPLMIQRREAEAEAEPQVFSGLPSASWFKNYKAQQSKKNKKNNGKREAVAGPSSSGKSNYISIPANAWAAALKKQKGGE
ncbi:hypothetical protein CB0940_10293 [Cercospora beticola]|uniref:Uncharacterized protein n=1 Tax=Cercospora beticola TaxID=122368 RepID=A0A2G5HU02_CERBT|nr:hypothetical protein CB0940_10293 [Cercospora beticola]PIA96024.1 hypothetical protein CB0940_10293 [Cercospora beticola]WPB07001.1 hypothetical protein RHO25_011661 [Cercospora beticola]CAK1366937.1 unnamed protein product [Cercospora beticola]